MSYMRKKLWVLFVEFYPFYLRKVFGMEIGKNTRIAKTAHLDKNNNPKGIHIGDGSRVLYDAIVLLPAHVSFKIVTAVPPAIKDLSKMSLIFLRIFVKGYKDEPKTIIAIIANSQEV